MKINVIRILYFFLIVLISGCSSDDNSNYSSQNIAEEIIGTWILTDFSGNSTTQETGRVAIESMASSDYTIEFTNNPNSITTSGTLLVAVEETENGITNNFNYAINGDFEEGFHTGEWRIENRNLVTRSFEIDPDEEGAFDLITDIIKLTSTSLILRIDNAQYSSENSTRTGFRTLSYVRD